MALTTAERQARWRERHITRRRDAQRIVNLLLRKQLTAAVIEDVAALLNQFLNRQANRTLRRELSRLSEARPDDPQPDRETLALIETMEDEQEGWEADLPGQQYPEHECGLSDREHSDLWRWRRQRARARLRQHGADGRARHLPDRGRKPQPDDGSAANEEIKRAAARKELRGDRGWERDETSRVVPS